MNEHDRTTQRVAAWLRDSTPAAPDPEQSVDEVMATLLRETQRTRTSLRWLGGRVGNEGGTSMLSALRFSVAAALVALVGGLFTVAVMQPQAGDAPGAAVSESPSTEADATPGPVTLVTGTELCITQEAGLEVETPYGSSLRGTVSECTNTMSDPRVSGSWVNTYDTDCYEGSFCLFHGTHVMDGPDGGWECEWSGSDFPTTPSTLLTGICTGTGAYEGLTYVFQHSPSAIFEDGTQFNGVIYEGPPPAEPLQTAESSPSTQ